MIITQHLNIEERKVITSLCDKYKNIFYYKNSGLTFTSKVKQFIGITETLKNTVTDVVNTCEICLTYKYDRHPCRIKFEGPLTSDKPLYTIFIDVFST